MSDSLLLVLLVIGAGLLICAAVWSWTCDHATFVGRCLLLGFAACLTWTICLVTLVLSGDSFGFRALWLPAVTVTAATIYLLARVANEPSWRPSRWLSAAIVVECVTVSVLTITNDHHQLIAKSLGSSHLEYTAAFGAHALFCFVLLSSAAVEMNRRTNDPIRYMRYFAVLVMVLVAATCTVQILQIRVSQLLGTIALIAYAVAAHRGGLGHRDPVLAQGFDPHDPVTGVLSRRSIEQHLTALAGRPRLDCQVLVIDVDRFKDVNDRFGHLAGDQVLAEVARRLCAEHPRLTLGRWGGDEFVGVVPGVDASEVDSLAEGFALACAVSPVTTSPGREIAVSVSIGSAPCDGDDWRAWIAMADAAMYASKDRSKSDE